MKQAILPVLLMLSLITAAYGSDEEMMPYEHNLSNEDVDLFFNVVRQPRFPESLKSQGYMQGHVTMLLELHFDGELRDWIVTSATHKGFAEAIERVIEDWEFAPPKRNGKPISLVIPIEVNFRSSGDVVSFNPVSGLNHNMSFQTSFNSFDSIKIAHIDKLDHFPEPIHVVHPKVSRYLIRKSNDSYGVFKFFIDTEGRVRLPHVDHVRGGVVDVRLLEAAQDALEEWQFAPPTVKGRKVVVEVKQPFHFHDDH